MTDLSGGTPPTPYVAGVPRPAPDEADLRARIPGWGVDADPADRPSAPLERTDLRLAPWDFPERQADDPRRERSIEHAFLTPVYGTAQPLNGLHGVIRRIAYARFSEGRAAHWLLLIVADRVDAIGAHLRSFATLRPDQPLTQTGVLGEVRRHPVSSRVGRGRIDGHHAWIDAIIVAGPWVAAAWVAWRLVRRAVRRVR